MNLAEWPDALTMPNMPISHCLQVNDLISWFLLIAFVFAGSACGSGGFAGSQLYFDSPVTTVTKKAFSIWNRMEIVLLFFCCCSVTQSSPTLCEPMDCNTPGFPVLYYLLVFAQTHVHWVSDAIQPSRLLSSLSPPAFSLSQHQGHFQWVGSSHQVAKVLELQLEHQSFQCIFRVDSFRIDWFDLLAFSFFSPHFLRQVFAMLTNASLPSERVTTLHWTCDVLDRACLGWSNRKSHLEPPVWTEYLRWGRLWGCFDSTTHSSHPGRRSFSFLCSVFFLSLRETGCSHSHRMAVGS